jgi:hypothetical protein
LGLLGNPDLFGGAATNPRELRVPVALDPDQVRAVVTVYQRSLAWFRRSPQLRSASCASGSRHDLRHADATVVSQDTYFPKELQGLGMLG